MLGQIIEGFCSELQALFVDTGVTILRDTDQEDNDLSAHTLPVIILDLTNTDETDQCIGGATSAKYDWTIRAYFYDSNSYLSPDSGFSTDIYNLMDTIKNHFARHEWLSEKMQFITNTYSFALSLHGTNAAPRIKHGNGIITGRQINYKSVSIDISTAYNQPSEVPLKKINQLLYF